MDHFCYNKFHPDNITKVFLLPPYDKTYFQRKFQVPIWALYFVKVQGIVGCTPIPTYPYGKSLYKPYIVGIYGL